MNIDQMIILLKKKKTQIGDFVRILNPNPGQENSGKNKGFYKDGKAKIRTTSWSIVRRLPHNISFRYDSKINQF